MVRIVETTTNRTECGHADHVVEEDEAERFKCGSVRGAYGECVWEAQQVGRT